MASTLRQVDPGVTGNSLTGVKATGRLPEDTPDRTVVKKAMRVADISQKAFALAADAPESHISDALKGYRPIQWGWLWKQDEHFWEAFWFEVRHAKRLMVSRQQRESTMRVVSAIQQLALTLQTEE